eukprot:gene17549-2287_t
MQTRTVFSDGHGQAVSSTSLTNQSRASVASAAGIELANGGGGGPKQLHGCGRRRCRKRSNGNHQGHGRSHMHNLSSLALQDGFSEARLRACTEAGLLGRINSTTLTTIVACASQQHARYCGWRTAARPHARLTGLGKTCSEISNALNCNNVGTAQPDGSCVCDGPVTGLGKTCSEISNALNCNNVGTAQSDGSCVCDGPVTGLGKTCSEISNALNCNNVGTAQADGSCVCDSPATGLGPTCSEFTKPSSCNNQATVNPDGTCAPPCDTNGYKGDRCDECFTDTHDLIENGTVSRIAFCADPTDPAT